MYIFQNIIMLLLWLKINAFSYFFSNVCDMFFKLSEYLYDIIN